MAKKIIILLVSCLLLAGCTVDYKLKVNKDTMSEDITISVPKEILGSEGKNILKNEKNTVFDNSDIFYDSDYKENNQNILVNYNYKYDDLTSIGSSKFLDWCYTDKRVSENNGILTISTNGTFKCLDHFGNVKIDKADVIIETDLKVLETNADEVKDNQYIWNINFENYTNKPIFIEINVNDSQDYLVADTKTLIIIFAIILGLILLFVLISMFKRKHRNSI